ncbi:cutinase [Mycena vulgaris]|nr:cutinase [Mycena vulgaris]
MKQAVELTSFLVHLRRGTSETGNVGAWIRPPLIVDLRATLGTMGIAAQGVDHDASVLGNLHDLGGDDPAGSPTIMSLINTAAPQCPSTKILVHNAAAKLTAAVTAHIAAGVHPPLLPSAKLIAFNIVIVFGDPYCVGRSTLPPVGIVPAAKVSSFCHHIICTGSGGAEQHLSYDLDAPAASALIVAHI